MTTRFAVLLLCFTTSVAASEVPPAARVVANEARRYGRDLLGIARAPLTWDAAMWRRVGLVAAADGAAFALDEELGDAVQRNRSRLTDDFSGVVTPFGGRRALNISAAVLLTGAVTKNPRLRESGRDAVEAAVLAGWVITPVLKRAANRTRPDGSEHSFPSGHATNAFAVASVFAAHSDGWVVPTIAYGLATGVAFARVNDNVHYTSDVLAGAAIGTALGRSIVARHRRSASREEPRVAWAIVPTREGVMFEVTIRQR